MIDVALPTAMAPMADGHQDTARVDVVACLDDSIRRQTVPAHQHLQPGRYLEIQGLSETRLIPLVRGVMHIGRGLTADLRLDDASVSRRHAILVNRSTGVRVLDDRSSYGTFMNGHRVTQADLTNGDVIVLGRIVLRYLEV